MKYETNPNSIIRVFILILMAMVSALAYGDDNSATNDWICISGVRVGPITATTTESDLIKIFGKKNVAREEIHVDEGYFEIGTFVFKGTPNEIAIFWKQPNDSGLQFPDSVIIDSAGSNWKTDDGLAIGTTIEELISINGDHIVFAGFGWDYEGIIYDWGNGKLRDKNPNIRLSCEHWIDIDGLSGDGVRLSSNDNRIKQLGLYISRIAIHF